MKLENTKVIDPDTNVTDADIQEAVLEGATDMETLQAKLKVAIETQMSCQKWNACYTSMCPNTTANEPGFDCVFLQPSSAPKGLNNF